LLGRKGDFWQTETFDRFIRDERHYHNAANYIENNPGSVQKPWRLALEQCEKTEGRTLTSSQLMAYSTVSDIDPRELILSRECPHMQRGSFPHDL